MQLNLPIRFVLNNKSDLDDSDGQAVIRKPGDENLAVYIDKKKVDMVVENLKNLITPDKIESVKVFRGEEARALFGYENVVVITSKQVNNP